ncbi:MAG: LysR family transcriptional regulator [Deltaproteobacteria bacterium]|nr:LysR family transcriptional regulator [Deltaproteobacteria bacterium]
MIGIEEMNELHVSAIDLNLLPVLDALLRERHVTRAARRVGLSQSAMSHALARLRAVLGDPILVRSGRTMVPTERAESLESPLREALASLESVLGAGERFDPATAEGTMRIGSEDFGTMLLAPGIFRALRERAPSMNLDVGSQRREAVMAGLENKSLDLAIGVYANLPASLRTRRLLEEDFACVVRRGHPRIKRRLTLKQYVELPHALIGVGDPGPTYVDRALAEKGLSRRVALRIGHFVAAPLVVAETDLVLTMPRRLAERLARTAPLQVHPPPVGLEPFALHAVWHERRQREPAHRFLRELVVEAASGV